MSDSKEGQVQQMAAEQGPRWRSRKEAWLDGYRHGEMQAVMTGRYVPVEDHRKALEIAESKIAEQRAYIDLLVKAGKGSEAEVERLRAERDQLLLGVAEEIDRAALQGDREAETAGCGGSGEEATEVLRELVNALDTAERLAAGGEEQEANVNRVLTAAVRQAKDFLKRSARRRAIQRAAEQVAADTTGFIRRDRRPQPETPGLQEEAE